MLGSLDGWAQGLREAGVEVRSEGAVDLVVAPASAASRALAVGAKALVLEGRSGRRRLQRAGMWAEALLLRPQAEQPRFLIPLEEREAAAYAIAQWGAGDTRWRRLRNAVAARGAAGGMLPELGPVVAVGTASGSRRLPYFIHAARSLGLPSDAGWFMTCGGTDHLSRNVFHVFPRGDDQPAWVLKFARLPGYDEPFRRDEAGLALAAAAGDAVADRAPRLVGRFEVDSVEASVETAAPGARLYAALVAPGSEAPKLRVIEEIAEWLLTVARETAAPSERLEAELDRLVRDVVPSWSRYGVTSELVRTLPPLPAVLQHNDMGCWNIVVGETGFAVVDWESARRHGLPLWDLAYVLTDALTTLDGGADGDALRLLRGESRRSPLLFGWIRRAADELGIPEDAVGPIVTLGWLHHGLSLGARTGALERMGAGEPVAPALVGRLAPIWLADPALGVEWRAWTGA
ncbi:MAG TPA: hypothetical protein VFR32_09870 [Gaiellaceae bacterium]|nr:hypothetical protein [Gaiellaceae bacterium]